MKTSPLDSQRLALLFAVAATFLPFLARGAETKAVRVAIGPFSAPPLDDELRQAGQLIPELLASDLSHSSRFQLVEREKIEAVWNELNLTAGSLVARDRVAKLGHVLACDWLISGSLVQANGRNHVWTKVIDVRDGVVLDLNVTPYEPGTVTNIAAQLAVFLNRAGTHPKGRQFITLDPIVDMNPPLGPKREDWSRRLTTLIEKHSLESGYGVAELAAVGPIFEERNLETAGLTGHPEGRVKLQPAFWLVDGGCEWVEGEPLRLAVGLRVQRVGGPAQMFRITNSPSDVMEKELLATLSKALADTNALSHPGTDPETELLAIRALEKAVRCQPFQVRAPRSAVLTPWELYKKQQEESKTRAERVRQQEAGFERTLLRDPENQFVKSMLAQSWLASGEAPKQQRGTQALREIAANKKDLKSAESAHRLLTNSPVLNDLLSGKNRGMMPRPKDWTSLHRAYVENPADPEIKCDLGAALIKSPHSSDRPRGRRMLAGVAAGSNRDQAERAQKLLAEPETPPTIDDSPPGALSAEEADKLILEKLLRNEEPIHKARREFFQKNFEKFMPIQFDRENLYARIQKIPVKERTFDYEGKHYCGFRFTAPAWIDGDFTLMHILAKTAAQKDFSSDTFQSHVVPKSGCMLGFGGYQTLELKNYRGLKERFPYTQKFSCAHIPARNLKASQEYAIWFGFKEDDMPDMAFAISISSEQGRRETGQWPVVWDPVK
jgi:hypothetical protein